MSINGNILTLILYITDKISHKLCFEKEKHLLSNFIEGFTKNIVDIVKNEMHPYKLNLSFIFEQKDDVYYSKKIVFRLWTFYECLL